MSAKKVWTQRHYDFCKRAIPLRRQARKLSAAGYRQHETDWEIIRGVRHDEIIVDAVISVDGKSVWTKIGAKP